MAELRITASSRYATARSCSASACGFCLELRKILVVIQAASRSVRRLDEALP
jgi:hypothetical protein